jgi:dolichol-phosphate mannosyltransferase
MPSGGVAAVCVASVIIPTYKEAPNIAPLLASLQEVRARSGLDLDVWLMDDRSHDGTREEVESTGMPWVHLVERDGTRGLSPAVLDGIAASRGRRVVVMDADLSHPAATIPALLAALDAGADFTIGSRYVRGASTDDTWGAFRRLNSKVATLLALPLARLQDPMSGFFAFDRALLGGAAPLNPVGYKIGLEIIVKCRAQRITEIPIHFAERIAGRSKMSFRQQMLYLEHLRRLYAFKAGDRCAAVKPRR